MLEVVLNRRLKSYVDNYENLNGTSGRTRTATLLLATDFESVMSTNSITLALN